MFIEFIKKYYLYIIIVIITLIGIIPTYFDSSDNIVNTPIIENEESIIINYIYVDIKGNVLNPGVYKLEDNTRLFQLIELSGGLKEDSDTSMINLSSLLNDQQVIYIPRIGEIIPDEYLDEVEDDPTENNGKININSASKNELISLPGIGEVTAQSIIDYRNENGDFETINDIINVPGIGENTFENIKDLITT